LHFGGQVAELPPLGRMSAATNSSRGVLPVRCFAWLAVALFVFVDLLLMPRGITVPWGFYIILYGPVIGISLIAIVGFAVCRLTERKISVAYLLITLAVLIGVLYDTLYGLRLRWHEFYQLFQ
jgi:hypothetical protein